MLRKPPASNPWAAVFKKADFSYFSLNVAKLSKGATLFSGNSAFVLKQRVYQWCIRRFYQKIFSVSW